ncbi:MAG: tyrosine-type recombinase/integrase [Bacteroidota bacterium]|nr:tyrosine-type recombinase/integrase [Bacteroidota bacterium]
MKVIEEFKEYLNQVGYNSIELKSFCRHVKEFLEYTFPKHEYSIIDLHDIDNIHINNFYEWLHLRPNKLKSGGLSEVSIYKIIFSLKVFFKYLESSGYITFNPLSIMKFKQPNKNSRQPLSQEEIKELFDAADTLREKAVLHLFYSFGLRRSEAEKLKISDIHLKSCILYVREGKGHKRRAIPMTLKVKEDLENYYLNERKYVKNVRDSDAFIFNQYGKRMKGEDYNQLLKKILNRTTINKSEVSLHHLRHSIATHLLENGLSVEYVRDFLGHSFLESTQIYTKVSKNQLIKL